MAAAGKGCSPGDEGPALRFRTSNSDEDYRSNPGTVPDRSSPNPALPSRGPHHGHDPRPDGSGQPAPRSDDLGQVRGHSVGFHVGALLDPRFFSGETRFLRILSPLEPLAFSTLGKQLWGIIEERVQTTARITTGRLNVQIGLEPRRIAYNALGRRVSELRGALNGVSRLSLAKLVFGPG